MFCPTYNVRDLSTFEVKLWCLVGQCIKYFFDSRFSTYQGFIGMSPCHKSREEDLYVHVSSSEAKVTLVCFKIEVLESTLKSLVVARSLILCHTSSSGSDYQVVTQADMVAFLEIVVIDVLNSLSIITVPYILNAISKLLGILTYYIWGILD